MQWWQMTCTRRRPVRTRTWSSLTDEVEVAERSWLDRSWTGEKKSYRERERDVCLCVYLGHRTLARASYCPRKIYVIGTSLTSSDIPPTELATDFAVILTSLLCTHSNSVKNDSTLWSGQTAALQLALPARSTVGSPSQRWIQTGAVQYLQAPKHICSRERFHSTSRFL